MGTENVPIFDVLDKLKLIKFLWGQIVTFALVTHHCIDVSVRLWPCMMLCGLVWSFVAMCTDLQYCGIISPFLAVIDPKSFGLDVLVL